MCEAAAQHIRHRLAKFGVAGFRILVKKRFGGENHPAEAETALRRFFLGALAFFDRKRDFCEHALFEMGSEVRKKALQRFEVVFRLQVQAWQTLLAEAQRAGQIDDVVDPHASATLIVGSASGMAKQRLRGWETGPVEEAATQAARMLWKGLAAR